MDSTSLPHLPLQYLIYMDRLPAWETCSVQIGYHNIRALPCFQAENMNEHGMARESRGDTIEYFLIHGIAQTLLKQPSHVKLMLVNSCWQTQIGVCERHYTCQLSRVMRESHACGSKTSISRIEDNFSRLTHNSGLLIHQPLTWKIQFHFHPK